jgi:hypothetical protein
VRDLCYSQQLLRQGKLMRQMMERFGVDPAFAIGVDGGLAWHEARTKCIFCSNVGACRSWLADSQSLLPSPGEFCPNMPFFRGCFSENLRSGAIVPTD